MINTKGMASNKQYNPQAMYHLILFFILPSIQFIYSFPGLFPCRVLFDGCTRTGVFRVFIPIYSPHAVVWRVRVSRFIVVRHRLPSCILHRTIRPVLPVHRCWQTVPPLPECHGRPAACPLPVPRLCGCTEEGTPYRDS